MRRDKSFPQYGTLAGIDKPTEKADQIVNKIKLTHYPGPVWYERPHGIPAER